MKTKRSTRFLSALLAFVMVALLIPFGVLPAIADGWVDLDAQNMGSLGRGYNMLGGKALKSENLSIQPIIVDLGGAPARKLPGVSEIGYTYAYITDMEAYVTNEVEKATVKIGVDAKIKMITASVESAATSEYSKTESFSANRAYALITAYKKVADYLLATDAQDIAKWKISQEVKDAVAAINSAADVLAFFERYGTHIVVAYDAGASGTYSYSSESLKHIVDKTHSESESVNTKVGLTGLGSIAVGYENEYSQQSTTTNESNKIYKNFSGYGSGMPIVSTDDAALENYFASITEETSMLMGDDEVEFLPIWTVLRLNGLTEDEEFAKKVAWMELLFDQWVIADNTAFYAEMGKTYVPAEDEEIDTSAFEIITNAEEFNNIRNNLGGKYILACNIDLEEYIDQFYTNEKGEKNWKPIGTADAPFTGELHGNGNTVKGLNITSATAGMAGLFGYNAGIIRDLAVEGDIILTEPSTTPYIGAIAAYNGKSGAISGCSDKVNYDIDFDIDAIVGEMNEIVLENDMTITVGAHDCGVKLIGQVGATYTGVNIIVEEWYGRPVYILLENANVVGSSSNAVISAEGARPINIVSMGESNSITGATECKAINAPNATLSILGNAPITVKGGDGVNGNRGIDGDDGADGWSEAGYNGYGGTAGSTGGNGTNGATAIEAEYCFFISSAPIKIIGGAGGNGGNGGTGGDGGDGDDKGWKSGYAGHGAAGSRGGDGGAGGDGATALIAKGAFFAMPSLELVGGTGGRGGSGGTGGRGGNGGRHAAPDPTGTYHGNPGRGGNGGNGGAAGRPGYVSLAGYAFKSGSVYISYGESGAPGEGGSGGGGGKRVTGEYASGGAKGSTGGAYIHPTNTPYSQYITPEKTYSVYHDALTWTDAQQAAIANGEELISINSAEEQAIVELLSNQSYCWIGLHRKDYDANSNWWIWEDGTEFCYALDPADCELCSAIRTTGTLTVELEQHDSDYYYDYHFASSISATSTIVGLSSQDTYVTLYKKVGDELVEIAYDDDSSSSKQFLLAADLVAGTTYVYRIRFYDSTLSGSISFVLNHNLGHDKDGNPVYTNWYAGEPNCGEGIEIYGGTYPTVWNDYGNNTATLKGYVTESDTTVADSDIVPSTIYWGVVCGVNEGAVENCNGAEWDEPRLQIESVTKTEYYTGFAHNGTSILAPEAFVPGSVKLSYDGVLLNPGATEGENVYALPFENAGTTDDPHLPYTGPDATGEVKEGVFTLTYKGSTRYIPFIPVLSLPTTMEFKDVDKNEFIINTDVTCEGLVMTLHFSTGVSGDIHYNSAAAENLLSVATPSVNDVLGSASVAVTCDLGRYGIFRTTYEVEYVDATVTDFVVLMGSVKTNYKRGEIFTGEGLELYVKKNNGQKVEISPLNTALVRYDYDFSEAGEAEVTVIYNKIWEAKLPVKVTVEDTLVDGAPVVSIVDRNAIAGGEVYVAVSLQNNPGIIGMSLNVTYDESVLELIGVEEITYETIEWGKLVKKPVLGHSAHNPSLSSPYILWWNNGSAKENFMVEGSVTLLKFKVSPDAPNGDYTVSVSYNEGAITNYDNENVKFYTESGTITVKDALIGDINGDGKLSMADVTLLVRYTVDKDWKDVKQTILSDLAICDVNGDGYINSLDAMTLERHLAGWEDYAVLPTA